MVPHQDQDMACVIQLQEQARTGRGSREQSMQNTSIRRKQNEEDPSDADPDQYDT